jgi:hypothetical protein
MLNLFDQLRSAVTAFTKFAAAGLPLAGEEEQDRRTKICSGCPLLIAETFRCGKCGCYLKYKIAMLTESCPDEPDKWKIDNDKRNNDTE